jgi:diaminopimelate epimerase
VRFTKRKAAGNDFVLVEAKTPERDWSSLARDICHRRFGIGADGLILVLPSKRADFEMRIFNADGSEAEACGNGIRCFARYVVERGLAPAGKEELLLGTISGIGRARLYYDDGKISKIQGSMGLPVFTPGQIPVTVANDMVDIMTDYPLTIDGDEIRLSFVSMGNPHAVCFCSIPVAEFPLAKLGPRVEHHPMFPNRVNFEVARVIDRSMIEARVWERGVGETLACGTGACAIMVIARRRGYVESRAGIKLPGGTLEVDWDGAGEVLLSGPAQTVYTGDWPE